jgi:hypothetical protein
MSVVQCASSISLTPQLVSLPHSHRLPILKCQEAQKPQTVGSKVSTLRPGNWMAMDDYFRRSVKGGWFRLLVTFKCVVYSRLDI